MKKLILISVVLIAPLLLSGCSVPSSVKYNEVRIFTKTERKVKGKFGDNATAVSIKDFLGNEAYEEEIDALKEKIEQYIAAHPDLAQPAKDNLRALKLVPGLSGEAVKLLIGKPLKVSPAADGSEIWVYPAHKMAAFSLFIMPVAFVREGYYLYFKEGLLTVIERHYLKQTVYQSDATGPELPQ